MASDNAPIALSDKTTEGLRKKILAVQLADGAQYEVISIYWDGKSHVAWVMAPSSRGVAF